MCLSPQADLIGGVIIGAIGIDVYRHVGARPNHKALAALPLMLAAHQITEAFVWWGLQGHVSADLGRTAMWIYLLFAFVVLPTYVPFAVWVTEPPGRRRSFIVPFVALGAIVSMVLGAFMLRGPVRAHLGNYHLVYSTGLSASALVVSAYVAAVCGSLVLSGYRNVAIFGVANSVAVIVLANITLTGFASLWCGWAAITSGALAAHLRWGGPSRSVPRPLIALG
jgi:hypothetical protein